MPPERGLLPGLRPLLGLVRPLLGLFRPGLLGDLFFICASNNLSNWFSGLSLLRFAATPIFCGVSAIPTAAKIVPIKPPAAVEATAATFVLSEVVLATEATFALSASELQPEKTLVLVDFRLRRCGLQRR